MSQQQQNSFWRTPSQLHPQPPRERPGQGTEGQRGVRANSSFPLWKHGKAPAGKYLPTVFLQQDFTDLLGLQGLLK